MPLECPARSARLVRHHLREPQDSRSRPAAHHPSTGQYCPHSAGSQRRRSLDRPAPPRATLQDRVGPRAPWSPLGHRTAPSTAGARPQGLPVLLFVAYVAPSASEALPCSAWRVWWSAWWAVVGSLLMGHWSRQKDA